MKFFVLLMAVGALTLTRMQEAWAHARWVSPTPRDNSTQYKNESFPCGGQPGRSAAQAVTTLVAGTSYMLRFEETVDHAGCFLIDFSPAGEANWEELGTVKHVGALPRPSDRAPRPYMQAVTMPNVTCTDCTLRVRQVMMDGRGGETAACPPVPLGNVPTYFSCANIVMTAGERKSCPCPCPAPAPPARSPEPSDSVLGCAVALGSPGSQAGLAGVLLVVALMLASARRRRRPDSAT